MREVEVRDGGDELHADLAARRLREGVVRLELLEELAARHHLRHQVQRVRRLDEVEQRQDARVRRLAHALPHLHLGELPLPVAALDDDLVRKLGAVRKSRHAAHDAERALAEPRARAVLEDEVVGGDRDLGRVAAGLG